LSGHALPPHAACRPEHGDTPLPPLTRSTDASPCPRPPSPRCPARGPPGGPRRRPCASAAPTTRGPSTPDPPVASVVRVRPAAPFPPPRPPAPRDRGHPPVPLQPGRSPGRPAGGGPGAASRPPVPPDRRRRRGVPRLDLPLAAPDTPPPLLQFLLGMASHRVDAPGRLPHVVELTELRGHGGPSRGYG